MHRHLEVLNKALVHIRLYLQEIAIELHLIISVTNYDKCISCMVKKILSPSNR